MTLERVFELLIYFLAGIVLTAVALFLAGSLVVVVVFFWSLVF